MTSSRLKHIRDTVEKHGHKQPKCSEVIKELLDYIEQLKNPQYPEQVALLMDKARKWFNRRPSTPFDQAEIRAIKQASIKTIGETDLDNLDWWYSLPEDVCFQKYGNGRKKTIASLFNNIGMEMLKAEQARGNISAPIKPSKPNRSNISTPEYLQWLDSQDFGDRMKLDWRDPETAPRSLISDFLEFQNEPTF